MTAAAAIRRLVRGEIRPEGGKTFRGAGLPDGRRGRISDHGGVFFRYCSSEEERAR